MCVCDTINVWCQKNKPRSVYGFCLGCSPGWWLCTAARDHSYIHGYSLCSLADASYHKHQQYGNWNWVAERKINASLPPNSLNICTCSLPPYVRTYTHYTSQWVQCWLKYTIAYVQYMLCTCACHDICTGCRLPRAMLRRPIGEQLIFGLFCSFFGVLLACFSGLSMLTFAAYWYLAFVLQCWLSPSVLCLCWPECLLAFALID